MNMSIWPNGLGQLTIRGRWQQVQLGRVLRRRYADLLSSAYESSEVCYVTYRKRSFQCFVRF